jgi:phosphoglycerate kinase
MKTVADVNFKGKKVLVRVDYNVPLNHNRHITDDTRIKESIPTIKKILDDGGSVILMSHLGRPKGGYEDDYSLTPIVPTLSNYLGRKVIFTRDLFGEKTKRVAKDLQPGEVALLENMRFYPEEEAGDEGFAKELASIADAYVNDAFATAHRAHASTATVAKFFPNDKYFGLLLASEIRNLDYILNGAQPPFTAIIGGAKVSSKLHIIKNLLNRVDNLIIGGGMAFTFIKALGGKIGNSLYEEEYLDEAKFIINEAMRKGVNILFPTDVIAADGFSNDANVIEIDADNIDDE